MIRNYFKIAFRSLNRNKSFSVINIFGLAIGLAACLLIMLYIIDESDYDKHHKDGDRIYRIASTSNTGETWAAAPGPMAWGVKSELPETEQVTRLMTFPDIEKMLLKTTAGDPEKQFFESKGYYVDSTFFQLFTYEFSFGDKNTALNEPNSIVISKKLSEKFFSNSDPTGKTLLVTTPFGEFTYTIKAVFDDSKIKSHIPANFFLSMRNNDMWNWVKEQNNWTNNNIFFTYIKLKETADTKSFEKKLNTLFDQHAAADLKAAGLSRILFMQPLSDIYLHSGLKNEIAANGSITYLYILGSIAAFILIIACINFMNLSTARSQKRAKEVGVRKVLGAYKVSLVRQFLSESFLMCSIALIIALALASLVLPVFNNMTHKDLQVLDKPVLIFLIIGLTLLTGLLAGLYPAFYLSSFKPVSVFKGKMLNSFSATTIRKGLVIFQFTVSISLILGAMVIWQQLDMMKNKALGFNKEQLIVLPLQQGFNNTEQDFSALKNELVRIPGISSVTSASSYPGIQNLSDMLFYSENRPKTEMVDVHLIAAGDDFLHTLNIPILSGRSFSKEFTADSSAIILNETAIRQLGYEPNTAVGKKIFFEFGRFKGEMNIVGVVKDFNFESLHSEIRPHGFTSDIFNNKYSYLITSVSRQDYAALVADMEKAWAKVNPATPFEYSFLDQDFQRNYQKEQQTSQIVVYFTAIAIFIACLGLFGLSVFSTEQRRKEIGIRKVLGASVANVTTLLSADFVKLILVAILIACPVAWFTMNQWLQGFAYRITIGWWMFPAAGALALVIALATISIQSVKAALTNPVKSLRTE